MRFSVLAEFFGSFEVLDYFFFGFAVSNIPSVPLIQRLAQFSLVSVGGGTSRFERLPAYKCLHRSLQ